MRQNRKQTRKQYIGTLKQWSKQKPTRYERTVMSKKCEGMAHPCFLGTKKSFPICSPSCKIKKGGIMSAYIRANEMYTRSLEGKTRKHKPYYYKNVAGKAKKMMRMF